LLSSPQLSAAIIRSITAGELLASETIPVAANATAEIVAAEYDEVVVPVGSAPRSLLRSLSSDIATLDGVGWQRKRLVGSVAVRPVYYDAASGRLRRYRRIVVRVAGGESANSKRLATGLFVNGHLSVERSVLADGAVYKVPIAEEGIFKIDRSFLSQLGLNPDNIEPNNVQVFGNGGAPLPALNSDPRPADLQERPVVAVGGGDGAFAEADGVFFYARGPSGWRFDAETSEWQHYVHPFSRQNYVFVRVGVGSSAKVEPTVFPNLQAPVVLTEVIGRHFVDPDVFIWSKEHGSGHTWVSNPIQSGGRFDIMSGVSLPGFAGGDIQMTSRVAIKSNPLATVQFAAGSQVLGSLTASRIISPGAEQPSAAVSTRSFSYLSAPAGPLSVTMTLLQQSNDPQAALDWLRLTYPQRLQAVDGVLRFSTPAAASGPQELRLGGFVSAPTVWDVTNPAAVRALEVRQGSGSFDLQIDLVGAAEPREIIAFDLTAARLLDSELATPVPAQNLHGLAGYPDFVIFTPPDFRAVANQLADRRRNEGLVVEVVDIQSLYNEFSGGVPDMRATRDYIKFLYDRAPDDENLIKYVLFLGDGHFDYRGLRTGIAQTPNHIFPYETEESYNPDRSYTSDDYFGLLDDGEGVWEYRGFGFTSFERMDVGIGRFPVRTVQEAQMMLDKVVSYESPETFGPWRGTYTYIADDAFTGATGNRPESDLHLQNIDSVAELVRQGLYPSINARKIYGESFERVFLNEFRIPDAKKEILKSIESGTLIVNYSGHGGPSGLAQEELFTKEDAAALTNRDKLSVFITATCSFGWWDIDDFESGAETLLLNPDGGAVAMLTTVRLVYTSSDTSSLNPGLNRALNTQLFRRDAAGLPVRLGDAMLGTKNTSVGLLGNSRKFNLLGDPTMRLGIPPRETTVDRVNGVDVNEGPGQLPALERITIAGSVRRVDGSIDDSFDGRVAITVFDAEREVPIRYRAFMPTPYYLVREDLIWRGSVRTSNGQYEATFVVPKDISYSNRSGRIFTYATNADGHAMGYTENVVVGGTSANPPDDSAGPEVSLFLNDTTFVSGGLTHPEPSLIVKLFDESGINTVGAGVGHELLLVVNGEESAAIDISSSFQAEENSFQRGAVQWDLSALQPGPGSVSVRAWDVLNNSSSETLEFLVSESTDLTIRNVYNYPNPTSGRTRFILEHNQLPGTLAEARVRIYSLNGRPIRTMEGSEILPAGSLGAGPVVAEWDGLDDDGDRVATGVYLYKVTLEVERPEGDRQIAEQIEKLALIR
jgi:hypothetical protein